MINIEHKKVSSVIVMLLITTLFSCSQNDNTVQEQAKQKDDSHSIEIPGDDSNLESLDRIKDSDLILMDSIPSDSPIEPETPALENYKVKLAASKSLKFPGGSGQLNVWIGAAKYENSFSIDMTQTDTTIPAVGQSATVEAFAPDFKVQPNTTKCILIFPQGSEVRFSLIPKAHGEFKVGANIYLYESENCSGTPIPRTTASLTVKVVVNSKSELWDIFWEKALQFWGALVALLFALLLFLIRAKLKKWFGFDQDTD